MTNSCSRFEAEGLERLERGEALDGHFAQCAECRSAAAAYDRLKTALTRLQPVYLPPPDWEARVWALIRQREAPRRSWRWALGLAGPLAAAVLVIAVWPRAEVSPTLEVQVIEAAAQTVRGVTAKPGDTLRLRATTPARHAELRLYRDGALVLHCSTRAPCRRDGKVVSADVRLTAVGRYQPVLVFSDSEIAPPPSLSAATGDGMNADMEAALGQKMQVQTSTAVDVF